MGNILLPSATARRECLESQSAADRLRQCRAALQNLLIRHPVPSEERQPDVPEVDRTEGWFKMAPPKLEQDESMSVDTTVNPVGG